MLNDLPAPYETVITSAYLIMHSKSPMNTQKDARFTIELASLQDIDYQSVKGRKKKEFIGYEVSNAQLKENSTHHFIFDSFCRQQLEKLHENSKPCYLIIRATSSSDEKSQQVDWHGESSTQPPQLVIEYVKRRKIPVAPPTNLATNVDSRQVKLTWDNPDDNDFVGCFVVRNRFHPPRSPNDGVKLYGGPDEYTFDNFGNANIPKYYSVFSYDDVPNFSEPVSLYYTVNETIVIDEAEFEPQDNDEPTIAD